ncbi:MAG: hypothetical protein WCR02_12890 [Sphaerochaetaceae bacterium]|jgi:hypothetical protein
MATKNPFKISESLLKIIVSLMYLAMGVEGFAKGRSDGALGPLYSFVRDLFGKAGDAFAIIVALVVFLSGLIILLSLFITAVPGSLSRIAMIVLMIAWTLSIVLTDFSDKFGYIKDFLSFMVWMEQFLVHLLVLVATISVYGKAINIKK